MTRKEDKAAKRATYTAEFLIHVRDRWVSRWTGRNWGNVPLYETYYMLGDKPPRHPLPTVHCSKIVWLPEGNPFREYGAYINLLGYNGREGRYGPGYYTVHCWKWNTVVSEW
jgi:hypothetical protein